MLYRHYYRVKRTARCRSLSEKGCIISCVQSPWSDLLYKLRVVCIYELYSNLNPDLRQNIVVFLGLVFLYRRIWSACHVYTGSNPSGRSPKRNVLLQSGCNFLLPITKCWFGISEFLRLAAVSDFPDDLLKKLAGTFPSLTITQSYTMNLHFLFHYFLLYLF